MPAKPPALNAARPGGRGLTCAVTLWLCWLMALAGAWPARAQTPLPHPPPVAASAGLAASGAESGAPVSAAPVLSTTLAQAVSDRAERAKLPRPLLAAVAVALQARTPGWTDAERLNALAAMAGKVSQALLLAEHLEPAIPRTADFRLRPQVLPKSQAALAALKDGRLRDAEAHLAALLAERPADQDPQASPFSLAWELMAHIAALRGDLARVDEVMLGLVDAVQRWAPNRQEALWSMHLMRAEVWRRQVQADDRGANVRRAIDIYRQDALPLVPRAQDPLNWADTQTNLGAAWMALARQQQDKAAAQEAIQALNLALEELTRIKRPQHWATAQHNLGNAQAWLAEQEPGTARLLAAVQAFRQALLERPRQLTHQWVQTQEQLADALATLGEREAGTEHQEQALQAYRLVLLECTQAANPRCWARTQLHMGGVLAILGQHGDAARLMQAAEALEAAVKHFSPELLPGSWARSQRLRGQALLLRGQAAADAALLAEAAQAYAQAMARAPRERLPLSWAYGRAGLATVHHAQAGLASADQQPALLDLAISGLQEAATLLTPEQDPSTARQHAALLTEWQAERARRP